MTFRSLTNRFPCFIDLNTVDRAVPISYFTEFVGLPRLISNKDYTYPGLQHRGKVLRSTFSIEIRKHTGVI